MRRRSVAFIAVLAIHVVAGVGLAAWGLHASRSAPRPSETSLEGLDRYGRVPAFTLMERSGRRVSRDDLLGHVAVIDFIYTECTETCPTQSLQFAQLQRRFAGEPGLRLVSITVDPEHDTPEVLRQYADRYGATDRWWFLTGDKRGIYCLARDGFRLAVSDPRATEPLACGATSWLAPARAWASHGSAGLLMHSARVALVDRDAEIRAYHLATDPASMAALEKNLAAVLSEPADRSRGGGR
jgi:cytochrome oxidase Cu insertion factor (SCO1/SenC/PrrC family)